MARQSDTGFHSTLVLTFTQLTPGIHLLLRGDGEAVPHAAHHVPEHLYTHAHTRTHTHTHTHTHTLLLTRAHTETPNGSATCRTPHLRTP